MQSPQQYFSSYDDSVFYVYIANLPDGSSFTDDVVRDVEITDVVGRIVVLAAKVSRQQNFNAEELSSGIYILRIIQDKEVRSLKFSVVR